MDQDFCEDQTPKLHKARCAIKYSERWLALESITSLAWLTIGPAFEHILYDPLLNPYYGHQPTEEFAIWKEAYLLSLRATVLLYSCFFSLRPPYPFPDKAPPLLLSQHGCAPYPSSELSSMKWSSFPSHLPSLSAALSLKL